jgi:hypothetical protein
VGGVFVYFWLAVEPKCEPCGRYLRVATKKKDSFSSFDEFAPYYDGVYVHPVDTPEFARHVGTEYSAGKAEHGTINLTTSVLECPKCFVQSIRETVQIHNGKEWKDATELTRFIAMPTGVDVRSAFS